MRYLNPLVLSMVLSVTVTSASVYAEDKVIYVNPVAHGSNTQDMIE